ncbi:MAG: DUF3887 domain-containing protein [Planctomycetes bacterium]|nr:DUF3887 domain-containing protein [Planctomycetota bacterium]
MRWHSLMTAMVFGIISVSLAGCGANQSKQAAEETANRLYQALSEKDWDKAVSFYGPQFFQKTSKQEWRAALVNLEKKFGAYKSHQIQNWKYRSHTGTGGSHQVTVITYKVKYAKATTTETITFLGSGDEELKIVGHRIESPAFLAPDK